MNKGYKLKSIEVGTYSYTDQKDTSKSSDTSVSVEKGYDTTLTYKKVKNNSKITLGTIPYSNYTYRYSKSSSDYSSSLNIYKYLYTDVIASTDVRITYIDKYTKQETTTTYTIRRFAK